MLLERNKRQKRMDNEPFADGILYVDMHKRLSIWMAWAKIACFAASDCQASISMALFGGSSFIVCLDFYYHFIQNKYRRKIAEDVCGYCMYCADNQ